MRKPQDILGLDPKNFKHVKSDKHSTTLQHKDGHMLTIAHSVLSPPGRAALSALSKIAEQSATPEQANEANNQKKADGGQVSQMPTMYDEGGKVPAPAQGSGEQDKQQRASQMSQGAQQSGGLPSVSTMADRLKNAWADGGTVDDTGGKVPVPATPGDDTARENRAKDLSQGARQTGGAHSDSPLSTGDWSHVWKAQGGKIEQMQSQHGGDGNKCKACGGPIKMADGGGLDLGIDPNAPMPDIDPNAINQQMQPAQFEQPSPEKPVIGPVADSIKQYLMQPSDAPSPQIQPADIAATKADAMVDQLKGKEQSAQQVADASHQQAAQQAQPAANDPFSPAQYNQGVSEMAGIQAKQLEQQVAQRQQAMNTYEDTYKNLESERQAHIADIQNGYVDPNNYWKDHSKVATGIGMILAGFNPTSKPNAAIEFLQHQMDNSLSAQKANLDSKNNLLKANLQHFGDLHQATMMTQAMMNDTLAQQMQQAALNAKNPLAKQAAMGASATLMQNAMQFQRQLAMQQTMLHLANGAGTPETQASAIAMMSAVNPEGAKVYRDAFVPGVGMSKSLTPIPEEVRQQIASGQKLQNAATDLLNYSHQHTNLNPFSAEYQVGATKARVLQQMVREGLLGTVFRESEKPLLNDFVGANPAGAFKMITTDPKIRTLIESAMSNLNTTKQTYGLPSASAPSQQTQPEMKTMGGVQYHKVPGGWQRVK